MKSLVWGLVQHEYPIALGIVHLHEFEVVQLFCSWESRQAGKVPFNTFIVLLFSLENIFLLRFLP